MEILTSRSSDILCNSLFRVCFQRSCIFSYLKPNERSLHPVTIFLYRQFIIITFSPGFSKSPHSFILPYQNLLCISILSRCVPRALPLWLSLIWSLTYKLLRRLEGTLWRSWLRHCATSRHVAGSIPDGVTDIFHWHNSFGRTMALRTTQPLKEYLLGGKGGRCVGMTLTPSCVDCLEIWEPQYPGNLRVSPDL